MNIFATDLDNTLIFSKKRINPQEEDNICIEKINGIDSSYVKRDTLNKLKDLSKEICVIPVTLRSLEQYKRVQLVDFTYAITSNGGIILVNGMKELEWEKRIMKIVQNIDKFHELVPMLESYIECFEKPLKCVDNIFYYGKLKMNNPHIDELLLFLEDTLDTKQWEYKIQTGKIYIIPRGINKESALEYLCNSLQCDGLVCAGDGVLDLGFLKLGEVMYVPEESEVLVHIQNTKSLELVPSGIEGTTSMLEHVGRYNRGV